jgi:hypothetical protein
MPAVGLAPSRAVIAEDVRDLQTWSSHGRRRYGAELDDQDLRPRPWDTRRATLASLQRKAALGLRLSEHLDNTDGQAVFRHACAMGLEGIVSKRRDRPYRSGRSSDWVKLKNPDAPAATRVIEW